MRKYDLILILVLIFSANYLKSQNVAINSDGSSPNSSAMLDVKSSSKGFLPPRMTANQRIAITSPATGLIVYQTDATTGFYYYNGTAWTLIGNASGATQWTTTGSEIYYNGGKVGVGTSTPSNHLQISSSNTVTPTSLGVFNSFGGQNSSGGDYEISSLNLGSVYQGVGYQGSVSVSAKIPPGAYSDGVRLDFSTPVGSNSNTQIVRMSILPFSGNVGIGTTVPTFPLQMGSGAYVTNAGVWTNASDARLKTNIVNTNYGLQTVMKLRPVNYIMINGGEAQVGFLAQEVQKIVPEVVSGKEGDIAKGETLGLSYGNLVPVLTKAIQEQQVQISELKLKVEKLTKLIETIQNK